MLIACSPSQEAERREAEVREREAAFLEAAAREAAREAAEAEASARSRWEALGMPPLSNAWSAQDYRRAASAIVSLAEGGAERLPNERDPGSREVFAKLISDPGIEMPAQPDGETLLATVGEWHLYNEALRQLFAVYVAAIADAPLHLELAEVIGAILRSLARADSLLGGLESEDVRNASATMLIGAVRLAATFSGPDAKVEEFRGAVLDHVHEYAEAILAFAGPAATEQLRAVIRSFRESVDAEPIAARLQAIDTGLP
jgi:hypothetical protein